MSDHSAYLRRYWFGAEAKEDMADTVLLMERDRVDQYQAALDRTECRFSAVFRGITGRFQGKRVSVVYSIGPAHVADCVAFLSLGFGIKRLFATGSIGGLSAEMGDIVLADGCATQDGYSLSVFRDEVVECPVGRVVRLQPSPAPTISERQRDRLREEFDCGIRAVPIFTVPAVSVEDRESLTAIRELGYAALDLETGPFLSACRKHDIPGTCIHWVTDLPLERDFYFPYHGDPELIRRDHTRKYRQWLNMPRVILPILGELWTT